VAAPAVGEDERLVGAQGLVGQDDLQLITVVTPDEEVELDRFFVLLFAASPNEEEAVARLPGLGFPLGLEVVALGCASQQKRRASMRALRSVKHSRGTLTVYSTPAVEAGDDLSVSTNHFGTFLCRNI
jgi:hypothetical protein